MSVGLGAFVVVSGLWLLSFAWSRDIEDATEMTLDVGVSLAVGFGTVSLVIISNLSELVAEAPGIVSTIGAGALGYLSLSGLVDIGPGVFVFVVISGLVGAVALREA